MNHIIIQTEKEMFSTDCFYYNKEKHYLNYHIVCASDSDEAWATISNVDCEIGNMNCNIFLILTERKEQKNDG